MITVDDPDLTMMLPAGWAEYPIATYRSLIASLLERSSPELRAYIAADLKDIDDGAVRMAAGGSVGLHPVTGTIILQVDSGDPSLDAAVARIGRSIAGPVKPTSMEQRPVSLAVGDAIRRVETQAVPPNAGTGAIPSRAVEYIARLGDGRTLWILATGPQAATTFEALIDAAVMTIRTR